MNLEEILIKIQNMLFEKYTINMDFDAVLMENGFDSVSIIELIINIEDLFDIEFDSSQLNYRLLKSIRTISEYIDSILRGTNDK